MQKTILFLLFIFILSPFSFVRADGGMIPYYEYEFKDIYEPSQTSLLVYNEGREDLYLKVSYEGETNKFVWIVPTPHYPEASKAPKDLFEELSALTVESHSWTGKVMPKGEGLSDSLGTNVIVHEQKQVGIYEITVLSATGAGSLLDWLNNNNYKVNEEAKDLLDWYVKKEWYFTAMRINEDSEDINPTTVYKYSDYIEPIKISFSVRTPVYPFKISQISTRVPEDPEESLKTNEILLYILSDNQVKAPGFTTEYAQLVGLEELEQKEQELYSEDLESLKQIIDKEYFLTKLRRDFARVEMDDDIYLIGGEDYNPIPEDEIKSLSISYNNDDNYLEAKNKVQGSALADRLKGKIVLKVEENGEAYYINPTTRLKRYLGRPNDAFAIMREQGIGITNANLAKIPVGTSNLSGLDSDGDGLSNLFEDAIGCDKTKIDTDGDGNSDKVEVENGYNPTGPGVLALDYNFSDYHKGKIFLQVENNGEAWYVNPEDGKRYFLGRPADAFNVMRNLGLGISNSDFEKL